MTPADREQFLRITIASTAYAVAVALALAATNRRLRWKWFTGALVLAAFAIVSGAAAWIDPSPTRVYSIYAVLGVMQSLALAAYGLWRRDTPRSG